jgi:hypothetical protein
LLVTLVLTTGAWVQMAPNPRRVPLHILAMGATWLVLAVAGTLRMPRWSYALLTGVAAVLCLLVGAYFLALLAAIGAGGMLAGAVLGWLAARGGMRRDGDIAMAVFLGYVFVQWMPTIF